MADEVQHVNGGRVDSRVRCNSSGVASRSNSTFSQSCVEEAAESAANHVGFFTEGAASQWLGITTRMRLVGRAGMRSAGMAVANCA